MRDARLTLWKAQELGYKVGSPITVLVDNAAGISFQQKMNPDSKLKGMIDLRWDWVRELQDKNLVQAVKVSTADNAADILTKCLSRVTYEHLLSIPITKAKALLTAAGEKQHDSAVTKAGI